MDTSQDRSNASPRFSLRSVFTLITIVAALVLLFLQQHELRQQRLQIEQFRSTLLQSHEQQIMHLESRLQRLQTEQARMQAQMRKPRARFVPLTDG